MTPHLNRLGETVQIRGHNICFYAELTKIIPNYHQILSLIQSSVYTLKLKDQRANSVYLDEVALYEPPHLAVRCLQIQSIFFLTKTMLIKGHNVICFC